MFERGGGDIDLAQAYDVETTGLSPYAGDEMFAFSQTDIFEDKTSVYRLDGSRLRKSQGKRALDKFWDPNITPLDLRPRFIHNAKFDLTFTEKELGRRLDAYKGSVHCTHKMSHILQNSHPGHGLDMLAWELFEYPKADATIRRMAKHVGGYHHVPEKLMRDYQIKDTERGMLLGLFFWPKIQAKKKLLECYETEMELIWTTMRMEARGVMLHRDRAAKMVEDLHQDLFNVRQQLYMEVGRRFNPNSDDQIRRILFREIGLPINPAHRTPGGKPGTGKDALRELRETNPHLILDLILKHRSYTKGSKLIQDYLELAGADGVIHPEINTCAAVTSRESCSNPNLQNVQVGGVLLNPFPVLARHAFRPRPGYVNLHIDYSGIEMRLLIHYAREPKMIDCILRGDGDVHAMAAEIFFGREFTRHRHGNKRWKTLRNAAKNGNFAIPYGASGLKVGKVLGFPQDGREGFTALARYRAAFGPLAFLTQLVSQDVLEHGFVETVFGRILHVPKNKAYIGTNYLIQGTAAGVLKRAQNRVHAYNETQTSGEVRLLLPIHDELVIEYPRSRLGELPGYLRDVRKLMIDFPYFNVPLEVSAEIVTSSWERKHPLEIAA